MTGVIVLILTIISAIVVAINTIAKNVFEKTIEYVVKLIPLIFTVISIILTIHVFATTEILRRRDINCTGGYIILVAMIIAFAVRTAYLIMVKKLFKKNEQIEQIV